MIRSRRVRGYAFTREDDLIAKRRHLEYPSAGVLVVSMWRDACSVSSIRSASLFYKRGACVFIATGPAFPGVVRALEFECGRIAGGTDLRPIEIRSLACIAETYQVNIVISGVGVIACGGIRLLSCRGFMACSGAV